MKKWAAVCVTLSLLCFFCLTRPSLAAEEPLRQFGFGKADITPKVGLRLSGYGSRTQPSEGVDEPLFARAMAIRETNDDLLVLVSVDTIGFSGKLTKAIHTAVEKKHGIPRQRFVICCTHSHTAPHLASGLKNLFAVPMTKEQLEQTTAYTKRVKQLVLKAVDDAIASLSPGRMFFTQGEATFAVNRRVITNGTWTGFGKNPRGPVDHSLPLLRITDGAGKKTRGLLFNYACHCTTFGGDYNRVNGDWAGYAAKYLEAAHAGVTAMCCIGCGADANPPRDSRHALKLAKAAGREIADEVTRLLNEQQKEIKASATATFGFAGLPIDRPSLDHFREALKNTRPQVRRHAENMLSLHQRMGRLPETYPMPIQVWRFGDAFTMVFLGGEVVAEYALRAKKEIKGDVWVTAYANDVFGYVASERMQSEGGYEVDFSMVYYNHPGRWKPGTEDVIFRRLQELYTNSDPQSPLSQKDALNSFTLPEGFQIELVAAEPLISDPINFAFGADGRLWVVEMGDYPRGPDGDDATGGRIRMLTDTDNDGQFDKAVTFLDGLSFPTGVTPWKDGILVTASPDLIYAEDGDGDGRAEHREVLWTGFSESNPQHRLAGFTYGLDHWLYLSGSTSHPNVQNVKTKETVRIARRDLRIQPDHGLLEPLSGQSQYGRTRDDWGNWFGNDNSRPLHHFAIADAVLARNPFVAAPSARVHLTTPVVAPPVYPTSRTMDRYNDLFALNRFTSACAPHVFRDVTLGPDANGAVFVCEPVHNLVSRIVLKRDGVTFTGHRHPSETSSEFLSSTDNWFRPTWLETGPDGALWVADMYRMVIEHPEWIPESWQEKLNLYAGNTRGRIYRISRKDKGLSKPFVDFTKLSTNELVAKLKHTNGTIRDTAQRLLIDRADDRGIEPLRTLLRDNSNAIAQLHALWTLSVLDHLNDADAAFALQATHPEIVRAAVGIVGLRTLKGTEWQPSALADHKEITVRYTVAIAAGNINDKSLKTGILTKIAKKDLSDRWMRTAIVSSSVGCADELLTELLRGTQPSVDRSLLTSQLIATALADDIENGTKRLLATILPSTTGSNFETWQLAALSDLAQGFSNRGKTLASVIEHNRDSQELINRAVRYSTSLAHDDSASVAARIVAVRLLGSGFEFGKANVNQLQKLLDVRVPPKLQSAAIEALANLNQPELLIDAMPLLTPNLRSEIQNQCLTNRNLAGQLLAAIENKKLTTSDLDAAVQNRLLTFPSRDVRERAEKVVAAISGDRQSVVNEFRTSLSLTGDHKRGQKVFTKNCAACHQHQKVGNDIGPKLSALKNKSPEFLLTAVLDPNRAMESKFKSFTIVTSQGKVFAGMILDESATAITLALPDGKRTSVLRQDIEYMKSGKSFMPEGLEKSLTPQKLADLFRFLRRNDVDDT